MKSRNIFILILVFSLFAVMASCAAAPEEDAPEYEVNISSHDLDGFKMAFSFSPNNTTNENIFGYIPNTNLADLAAQRKADVEKALNCKIEMLYNTFEAATSQIRTSVMSASHFSDAILHESFTLTDFMRAGYLVGLSDLLDVKNTEKWGTYNMLESMFWIDDQFAVIPNSWPELLLGSFGYPIAINEDLVLEFGVTDPREYVENNTWTWDQFEITLHDLTQQKGENTVYAMAVHSPYFAEMMLRSNGNSIVEYSNGQITNGIYTQSAKEAMERAKSIFSDTCKDCFYPDITTGGTLTAFLNGDAVMSSPNTEHVLGTTSSILYTLENVGILPYPQGPNANPGEYRSTHETMRFSISIPINSSDYEATAMILDAIYEPLPGYEEKEDIIEYMVRQVFHDERDAIIYLNMLGNTTYNYFSDGARRISEYYIGYSGSGGTITQILDSNEAFYQEIFDNYMSKHYQGILAVWGDELN